MEKFQIKPAINYSIIPIIIIVILLIINIILLKKNKKPDIKKKYLLKIKILDNQINLNKVEKIHFQRLSLIIRNYISETHNINIQNYSLNEIKKLNNKKLTNLIEKLYEYEFSNRKCKNIQKLFNQAKEVIEDDYKV